MTETGHGVEARRQSGSESLRRDIARTRMRLARTQGALSQLSELHCAAMVAARVRPVVVGDCAWPGRLCDALNACGAFSAVVLARREAQGNFRAMACAGQPAAEPVVRGYLAEHLVRVARAAWLGCRVQCDPGPAGAAAVPLCLRGVPVAVLVLLPMRERASRVEAAGRHLAWPQGLLEHIAELLARGLDEVHDRAGLALARMHERALALRDELTGLMNRTALAEQFGERLSRARAEGRGLAVGMVDLDGFKGVNDRYGHATGDRVLRDVAARMTRALRDTDLVARVGGDEFVLVLDCVACDPADPQLDQLMARVQRAVEAPIELRAGLTITVGMSAGIAVCPGDGATLETLVTEADAALYRSKASKAIRTRAWCYAGGKTIVSAAVTGIVAGPPRRLAWPLPRALQQVAEQLRAMVGRPASRRPGTLAGTVRVDRT